MNPNLSQFLTQNPCPYDFQTSLQNVLAQSDDDDGFIAMGGDLHPSTLISAYSQGLFPWFNEGEPIAWWSPSPRCIIYPHLFSPSKTLKRTVKSQNWYITINRNFPDVINACSEARAYGDGTWINPDMISAYTELNQLGFAYSVEVWDDNPLEGLELNEKANLIGGLYGLKLGQAYFGESMFHRATDASKVAFWALMRLCERSGFAWVDCQLPNNHLMSLGAKILPRTDFLADLPKQIFKESCDWSQLMGQEISVKDLFLNSSIINKNNRLVKA